MLITKNNWKIASLILPVFFLFLSSSLLICNTDSDTVLSELSKKNSGIFSIKADFTLEKYIDIVENTLISNGNFIFKAPNKFRWDTTSPEQSFISCNGEIVKIFYPEINTTDEYPISKYTWLTDLFKDLPMGSQFDFKMLKKKYNIILDPDGKDKECYHLKLKPQCSETQVGYKLIEIDVNKKDYNIGKIIFYAYDDDMMTINFSKIVHNEIIDDDLFNRLNPKEEKK
jgi:outer membrane lipoprotein-sorting protein